MKKNLILIISFLVFLMGFLSIVLNLVGLELQILTFLDSFNEVLSLLVKLILIFGGLAVFYIYATGVLEEDDE